MRRPILAIALLASTVLAGGASLAQTTPAPNPARRRARQDAVRYSLWRADLARAGAGGDRRFGRRGGQARVEDECRGRRFGRQSRRLRPHGRRPARLGGDLRAQGAHGGEPSDARPRRRKRHSVGTRLSDHPRRGDRLARRHSADRERQADRRHRPSRAAPARRTRSAPRRAPAWSTNRGLVDPNPSGPNPPVAAGGEILRRGGFTVVVERPFDRGKGERVPRDLVHRKSANLEAFRPGGRKPRWSGGRGR